MSESDLDEAWLVQLRRQIEAELEELLTLSETTAGDTAPVQLDQQSVGRLSRMDAMQVQAMAIASEQRRTARISNLKAALDRLDSGDFGYCTSCEEPIPAGRLQADPTARLCVSCARFGER